MKKQANSKSSFQKAIAMGVALYSNKDKFLDKINKVYSNVKGEASEISFDDLKNKARLVKRLAQSTSRGEYKNIAPSTLFKIAIAAAYFSFGTDLIPDNIPGFGMVDDIAILTWATAAVFEELEKFETWETQSKSVQV